MQERPEVPRQSAERNSLGYHLVAESEIITAAFDAVFEMNATGSGDAIGAFESVGISVARLRLMKFGTALCKDQSVNGEVSGFAVERQFEAVGQDLLKHPRLFRHVVIEALLARIVVTRTVFPRLEIVFLGVQPVRCSDDAIVFDSVCGANDLLKRGA